MTTRMTSAEEITRFMFAGRSTFTIRSQKTGLRFTFKVEASDRGTLSFVSLMNSQDNEGRFQYLGLFRGPDYEHGKKSKISQEAPSAKAFSFFAKCLRRGQLHEQLEFYHEGRCGRCSRKLTTPASVLTGIGPECCETMGISQVQPPKVQLPKCEEVKGETQEEKLARAFSQAFGEPLEA